MEEFKMNPDYIQKHRKSQFDSDWDEDDEDLDIPYDEDDYDMWDDEAD
jgi:hypothetical protein